MTENEAKKILQRDLLIQIKNKALPDGIEAIKIAIKALEEVQQYRAIGTPEELQDMKSNYFEALSDWRQYRKIGTVEECRTAREKQISKKPDFTEDKEFALCLCCFQQNSIPHKIRSRAEVKRIERRYKWKMKISLKNAELVNIVIRKKMTIMFIAGKEMENVNINHISREKN